MVNANRWKATVERTTDSGLQWHAITSVQLQEITSGSIECVASQCSLLVVQDISELPLAYTYAVGGASGSWSELPTPASVSQLNSLASRPGRSGWIAAGSNPGDGPVVVTNG
jgi:hypothetical protein